MDKKERKISYGLQSQIEIIIFGKENRYENIFSLKEIALWNTNNKSCHLDIFFNYKIKKKKKNISKRNLIELFELF